MPLASLSLAFLQIHGVPALNPYGRPGPEDAACAAGYLGGDQLALSSSFLPVAPVLPQEFSVFPREGWKAMKKDFGVTTRQFCNYVLALTLSTTHQ